MGFVMTSLDRKTFEKGKTVIRLNSVTIFFLVSCFTEFSFERRFDSGFGVTG